MYVSFIAASSLADMVLSGSLSGPAGKSSRMLIANVKNRQILSVGAKVPWDPSSSQGWPASGRPAGKPLAAGTWVEQIRRLIAQNEQC
jgi:hypothetical protein